MKKIPHFLFQFFVIDQDTNKISHTKFWSHIGYLAMTFCFLWAVTKGTTADVMIFAMFGLVVIGNRSVLKLFGKGSEDGSKRE